MVIDDLRTAKKLRRKWRNVLLDSQYMDYDICYLGNTMVRMGWADTVHECALASKRQLSKAIPHYRGRGGRIVWIDKMMLWRLSIHFQLQN